MCLWKFQKIPVDFAKNLQLTRMMSEEYVEMFSLSVTRILVSKHLYIFKGRESRQSGPLFPVHCSGWLAAIESFVPLQSYHGKKQRSSDVMWSRNCHFFFLEIRHVMILLCIYIHVYLYMLTHFETPGGEMSITWACAFIAWCNVQEHLSDIFIRWSLLVFCTSIVHRSCLHVNQSAPVFGVEMVCIHTGQQFDRGIFAWQELDLCNRDW